MWWLLLILTLGSMLAVSCRVTMPQENITTTPPQVSPEIIIVYDNNAFDNRLRTDWGFACIVRLPGKTILFDTGGDSSILLHNMRQLQINPGEIETIIVSHIHGDHVGGLNSVLKVNSAVTVYLLKSFPGNLKNEVRSLGASVEEIYQAKELFTGVYTTGSLGNGIEEQSLAIVTSRGLVIITGCAHPGIVKVIEKAREVTGNNVVCLAMGGFHLSGASSTHIESIIDDFGQLTVEKVAPCHCSGDNARQLFKKRYKRNYIESGAGTRISLPSLNNTD